MLRISERNPKETIKRVQKKFTFYAECEFLSLLVFVCHIFFLTLHQFQAAAVVQEGLYRKGVIEIIFYTQTSQL